MSNLAHLMVGWIVNTVVLGLLSNEFAMQYDLFLANSPIWPDSSTCLRYEDEDLWHWHKPRHTTGDFCLGISLSLQPQTKKLPCVHVVYCGFIPQSWILAAGCLWSSVCDGCREASLWKIPLLEIFDSDFTKLKAG